MRSCVVILEPNPFVSASYVSILKTVAPGMRAIIEPDGMKGVVAIAVNKPWAIITELELEQMDGASVLRALQCDPDYMDIPALVVSAVEDPSEFSPLPEGVEFLRKGHKQKDKVEAFLRQALSQEGEQSVSAAPRGNKRPSNQAGFLDALKDLMGLKNDRALAQFLSVPPSTVSNIRHGKIGISERMILHVHRSAGLSLEEVRGLGS